MKLLHKQTFKHELDGAPYTHIEVIASKFLEIHYTIKIEGNDHSTYIEHATLFVDWRKILWAIPKEILNEYVARTHAIGVFSRVFK